jgi:DNA-binding CsgD family transcriptional regulator
MNSNGQQLSARSKRLMLLIGFQLLSAFYFMFDVGKDMMLDGDALSHAIPEIAATVALFIGILFEVRVLQEMLRKQERLTQGLGVAAGELASIMETYFRDWGLTAAEQDVATFTIKGYSIGEIASLRGSAEGTIKTHLNAIYRKADVPGRAQLVSVLVEDLLRAPLIVEGANGADAAERETVH